MLEGVEASQGEEVAVLVHSLNRLNGLVCIDDQMQECEFAVGWRQEGALSYVFAYRTSLGTVLTFTITPKPDETVEALFGVKDSKETFRVVLKKSQTTQEQITQYEFTLKQFLKDNKHRKPDSLYRAHPQ